MPIFILFDVHSLFLMELPHCIWDHFPFPFCLSFRESLLVTNCLSSACLKIYFTFFNLNLFWLEANYFAILYWFCHTSTWIRHGCTRVPHPEPLSQLSPHTIPLGHPSAPAPSILYPASDLDWQFIPYMILYMFNNQHQRECKEEGIVSWGEGDTIVRNRFTLHYIFLYIYIYCLFD